MIEFLDELDNHATKGRGKTLKLIKILEEWSVNSCSCDSKSNVITRHRKNCKLRIITEIIKTLNEQSMFITFIYPYLNEYSKFIHKLNNIESSYTNPECEKSPSGRCEYFEDDDTGHFEEYCTYCNQPYERK